jgi:hypothetical protein
MLLAGGCHLLNGVFLQKETIPQYAGIELNSLILYDESRHKAKQLFELFKKYYA